MPMSSSTDSVVAKSCFAKVLIIFFSPCTKNRRAWLVHVLGYDKLGFDKPTSSCPPAEKQQAWRYCGSTFRLTIVKTNSLANQHRPDRELNRIREVALSFMGARATAQFVLLRRTRCVVPDCSRMPSRLKRHALRIRGAGSVLSLLTIACNSR